MISHFNLSSVGTNVEVYLQGNWEQVSNFLSRLGPSIQEGYNNAERKFSKRVMKVVKEAIRTGTPPKGSGITWAPLAPSTIKRWNTKYPEHHLYYLTGTYLRAIGVYRYKNRTLVGLPINIRNRNGRLTLKRLASILEGGTDFIPARPLWGPTIRAVGGVREYKKLVIREIRRKLYSNFNIKSNQVRWS